MEIVLVIVFAALSTLFCGATHAASPSPTMQRSQSIATAGAAKVVLTETLLPTGVLSRSTCQVEHRGSDVLQSCQSMSKQLSAAEFKAAVAEFENSVSAGNSATESQASAGFSPASRLAKFSSGTSQSNRIRVQFDKSSASRSLLN